MVEGCKQFGFALETSQAVGILSEILRQDLDRDIPPQFPVIGSIDLSHTALTERFLDVVMSEFGSCFDQVFGSRSERRRVTEVTLLDQCPASPSVNSIRPPMGSVMKALFA